MKRTYFEAINYMYVGSKFANRFDLPLFYEVLVTSEQIVLANEHILDVLERSRGYESELLRLIEKESITIVRDFIPINLRKHQQDPDIIIELNLVDDNSINALFDDPRYSKEKRHTRRVIEKRIKTLEYSTLDIADVCKYVCKVLNNKELLDEVYRVGTPYRMINNSIPTCDYVVKSSGNILYIDADEKYKNELKGIFVGDFMFMVVRTYLSMRSQLNVNADSLIVDIPSQLIYERLSNINNVNSIDKVNKLLTVENMPNLEAYIRENQFNFNDAVSLRKKLKRLRKFLVEYSYSNDIEFYKEYRDLLDAELRMFDNTKMDISYKILRLILTSSILPLGIAVGLGEIMGYNKKIVNTFRQTIRLQDVFK